MSNLNSLSNNNFFNKKNVTLSSKIGGKYRNLLGIIIAIICLIIIIVVLHHLRKAYQANKIPDQEMVVLEKYAFDCKNNHKIIEDGMMPKSVIGNEYNISFWIYINDINFNYQRDKNIMVKGDITHHLENPGTSPAVINPRIYLEKESNNMVFEFEVDHFLDPNAGCYQIEGSGFAPEFSAPSMLESDCKNKYTGDDDGNGLSDDYYALARPSKQGDFILSKCIGLESGEVQTMNDNNLRVDNNFCASSVDTNKITLGSENHMYLHRNKGIFNKKTYIHNVPIQKWNFVSVNVHDNNCDIFFNDALVAATEFQGSIKPNNFPLILGAITTTGESGFDGYLSSITYTNYALTKNDIIGGNSLFTRGPKIMKNIKDSIMG